MIVQPETSLTGARTSAGLDRVQVKDPAQTGSYEKIGVLLGIFVSQLQPLLLNLGFSTKGSLLVISQNGGDPIPPGR